MDKLKRIIVKTPLAKLAFDIKANLELSKFSKVGDRITGYSTVYCISPYKTGTRYLNGCYDKDVSAHEALHYLSLREFNRNFNDFFIKRLNTLNLKLESSGFLSAYVDDLAAHPIGKNLNYVVVLRSPSSWITSSVNYWDNLAKVMKMDYHYTNELFWKNKVGVNLDTLLSLPEKDKTKGLDKLGSFYLDFIQKTRQLKNVHYVNLNDIDSILPTLDNLIQENSHPDKGQILASKKKPFKYINKELDEKYNNLVLELIQKK